MQIISLNFTVMNPLLPILNGTYKLYQGTTYLSMDRETDKTQS